MKFNLKITFYIYMENDIIKKLHNTCNKYYEYIENDNYDLSRKKQI